MANNLMEHALQMERHAEQLATGLAQAGADKKVVQTVTQCASIGRAIAKELGNANQNPEEANQSPEDTQNGPAEDRMNPDARDSQQPPQRKGDLHQASKDFAAEYNRKRQRP